MLLLFPCCDWLPKGNHPAPKYLPLGLITKKLGWEGEDERRGERERKGGGRERQR